MDHFCLLLVFKINLKRSKVTQVIINHVIHLKKISVVVVAKEKQPKLTIFYENNIIEMTYLPRFMLF